MGVDLSGGGRGLYLGWPAWSYCLGVAAAFGWQPEGTEAETYYNEDGTIYDGLGDAGGSYFYNEGQRVTDSDAKALAAALDRAIRALAAGDRLSSEQLMALAGPGQQRPPWNKATEEILANHFGTVHTPTFSYDAQLLSLLADFARESGFTIG
jgi:hypothetical protein